MVKEIFYLAGDIKKLRALAVAHNDNAFILTDTETARPLPFLFLAKKTLYHLAIADNGVIAGVSAFSPPEEIRRGKRNLPVRTITWLSLCVRPEFQDRGIATSLIRLMFEKAAKNNCMLRPSRFEPDGKKYLSPILPRLHREFPDVVIEYSNGVGRWEISGKRSYEINTGSGTYIKFPDMI